MVWTRFQNSTTADADEVHNNFKEVRDGDLLPTKLSTTASTTDGVYNIGAVAKRWNNGYINTIHSATLSGTPDIWQYIGQVTIDTTTSEAAKIQLTAFTATTLRIMGRLVQNNLTSLTDNILHATLNDDSSTSAYSYESNSQSGNPADPVPIRIWRTANSTNTGEFVTMLDVRIFSPMTIGSEHLTVLECTSNGFTKDNDSGTLNTMITYGGYHTTTGLSSFELGISPTGTNTDIFRKGTYLEIWAAQSSHNYRT